MAGICYFCGAVNDDVDDNITSGVYVPPAASRGGLRIKYGTWTERTKWRVYVIFAER